MLCYVIITNFNLLSNIPLNFRFSSFSPATLQIEGTSYDTINATDKIQMKNMIIQERKALNIKDCFNVRNESLNDWR